MTKIKFLILILAPILFSCNNGMNGVNILNVDFRLSAPMPEEKLSDGTFEHTYNVMWDCEETPVSLVQRNTIRPSRDYFFNRNKTFTISDPNEKGVYEFDEGSQILVLYVQDTTGARVYSRTEFYKTQWDGEKMSLEPVDPVAAIYHCSKADSLGLVTVKILTKK